MEGRRAVLSNQVGSLRTIIPLRRENISPDSQLLGQRAQTEASASCMFQASNQEP